MAIQTNLVYKSGKEPGYAYREWLANQQQPQDVDWWHSPEKQAKTFKWVNRSILIFFILGVIWQVAKGMFLIAMDDTPVKQNKNWRHRHRIHDLKYY